MDKVIYFMLTSGYGLLWLEPSVETQLDGVVLGSSTIHF